MTSGEATAATKTETKAEAKASAKPQVVRAKKDSKVTTTVTPASATSSRWSEAAQRVLRERYLKRDADGKVIETPDEPLLACGAGSGAGRAAVDGGRRGG